jgi:transketolase
MLNPDLKLNNSIFNKDVENAPIRKGFGEGLLRAGELNKDVVGLCADLTESTYMSLFKDKFPDRFIDVGVAEQNLVTVASGMASMGKIAFVTSYTMFSPGRNWEQIRTTICYNDRPVKIIGSHAGISVGPDGGTHQAIEDIALMRVMPRMVVISPCDAIQAKKATIACMQNNKPTYIRLAREKTPVITTESTPFEIGKGQVVFISKNKNPKLDVGIVATGSLLYKAILVAQKLENEGRNVVVVNIHTIKPLDEDLILNIAQTTKALVTVEEHQIAGGLGSVVAEFLASAFPVPIEFIGIKDDFGQSGTPSELIKHYGMDENDIYNAVQKVIVRKG